MDRHRLNFSQISRALVAPGGASSDFDLDAAPPAARAALREAAVLVPLVERGAGLNLLLTRRAARLRRHPGQVAFPGGQRDPGDASLLDAALREAREEIGLPAGQVAMLGRLDRHETVTGFAVTPFVGLIPAEFRPAPDRAEVAEVFEAPLGFVLDPANFQVHHRRWQGGWRSYYAIPYGPYYIWGATARMLRTLADRMQDP